MNNRWVISLGKNILEQIMFFCPVMDSIDIQEIDFEEVLEAPFILSYSHPSTLWLDYSYLKCISIKFVKAVETTEAI